MTQFFASDRAVIEIAGPDAVSFLNGLITQQVEPGRGPAFAALLTPQGKIVSEMIVHPDEAGRLYLDIAEAGADDLLKRLSLYKLRANVDVIDRRGALAVALGEGSPDPRSPDLPARAVMEGAGGAPDPGYDAARITAGVGELFKDYEPAELFPAHACMDWHGGVNLKKGCFIGQEVVSRMHRRGSIRKRMLPVRIEGGAPGFGASVTAGGKTLGDIRTSHGETAIALLRIDRLDAADASPETDGRPVQILRTGPT